MPFIHVEVLKGLSVEKKQKIVEEITDTFNNVANIPKDRVFVFFEDLDEENYAKNGSLVKFLK